MNKKGFVVSAVLYPLLVLFLALVMGLLSMASTRKRILDTMKLDISDSIFDSVSCDCEVINNTLKKYGDRLTTIESDISNIKQEITDIRNDIKNNYVTKTELSSQLASYASKDELNKLKEMVYRIYTPTISLSNPQTTWNSIKVPYIISSILDIENTVTCKYGTSSDNLNLNGTISNNTCTMSNLSANTTYYYQICVTTGYGSVACDSSYTSTSALPAPVITFTNDPQNSSTGYVKKQIANITFNSSGISDPSYYIKTTRAGISSIEVSESCGTGTTPGACTDIIYSTATSSSAILITSLEANTWYKVNGNLTVTYQASSNLAGTIYATMSNSSGSSSSSGTLSKIDTGSPGMTIKTNLTSGATDSVTLNIDASDYESGITSITCRYGTTSGSYDSYSTVNNNKCVISGLKSKTTYYYQVCATDYAENSYCRTGSVTLNATLKVGDVVRFTPTSTYYEIPSGAGISNEAINPSELTEWVVFEDNGDGTYDAISRYTSSTPLKFYGYYASYYSKFGEFLSGIAGQYTDGKYVTSGWNIYNVHTGTVAKAFKIAYGVETSFANKNYWLSDWTTSYDITQADSLGFTDGTGVCLYYRNKDDQTNSCSLVHASEKLSSNSSRIHDYASASDVYIRPAVILKDVNVSGSGIQSNPYILLYE